jgi:hypothetical protein
VGSHTKHIKTSLWYAAGGQKRKNFFFGSENIVAKEKRACSETLPGRKRAETANNKI